MIKAVLLIAVFIGIIWGGIRKTGKMLANDLSHTIEKAHTGMLPVGVYAEQYVSVNSFPEMH